MYTFNLVIILLFFLLRSTNVSIQNIAFNKIDDILNGEIKPKLNYYKIIQLFNISYISFLYISYLISKKENFDIIFLLISVSLIFIFIKENTQLRKRIISKNTTYKKEIGIQVSLKEMVFNKKNISIQSKSEQRLQKILDVKQKKII